MAKRKKDNDESSPENQGLADDSADNFGLPEIEYKPLDRTEEVVPERETPPPSQPESSFEPPRRYVETQEETMEFADGEEPRSRAPLIISLIIGVVIVASGLFLYKYWYIPRAKAKQEQLAKEAADKKKQEDDAKLAKANEEAERQRLAAEAALKAKPPAGTIQTLSTPTRKYYVIVSSDIDGDLIMDFAKKLSGKGISSTIIPPFGKSKFSRIALGDFDSYASAQSSAEASKTEYGSAVWVMRY